MLMFMFMLYLESEVFFCWISCVVCVACGHSLESTLESKLREKHLAFVDSSTGYITQSNKSNFLK